MVLKCARIEAIFTFLYKKALKCARIEAVFTVLCRKVLKCARIEAIFTFLHKKVLKCARIEGIFTFLHTITCLRLLRINVLYAEHAAFLTTYLFIIIYLVK
jgi:hypothetical protein